MAAINFPDSPSVNDTYTVGDKTWRWDGNYWRILALPSDIDSLIKDADNDTKVQVEESADEDIIRFDIAGTEKMTLDGFGLDVVDDLDVHGNITVDGQTNIGGHVIPDTDVTYDLGSATYRFRDLYLSGTSINLGGVTLSSDGTTVTIPDLAVTADIEAATVSASTSMTINSVTMTSDGTTVTIPNLAVTAGIPAGSIADGAITAAKLSADLSANVSSQAGPGYTLDYTDLSDFIQFTSSSAVTVTVPPASTEGWVAGNTVTLAQMGAGQVTVQGDTGVTIRTSTFAKTRTLYSVVSLTYLGSETWMMSGDMAAF